MRYLTKNPRNYNSSLSAAAKIGLAVIAFEFSLCQEDLLSTISNEGRSLTSAIKAKPPHGVYPATANLGERLDYPHHNFVVIEIVNGFDEAHEIPCRQLRGLRSGAIYRVCPDSVYEHSGRYRRNVFTP